MILGQRIRLDLNNVQATFCERCAGAARFAYNWGLAQWKEMYEAGEKPSWPALNTALNELKVTEPNFHWLTKIPWAVPNHALRDLGNAFAHFFRRVKAGQKPGYPKFKSKKRTTPAFTIEGRALQFDGKRIKIPKLGWIRVRQGLRFPGKVLNARFTKHAGHWYVSVKIEIDEARWTYPHRCETQAATGVDWGVVDIAVLSTGERVEAPRSLRRYEAVLRRLNRELSRRRKGGSRWHRTKAKLARLHVRITNIRANVIHNLTAGLVKRFRWIGIEDLNVSGMVKNHHLARSVLDAAPAELRRQLIYKADLASGEVVVADRWFPSSKTCHACGIVREGSLPLHTRHWTCGICGVEHDRDVNAAKNLEAMAAAHAATAQRPAPLGAAGWESSSAVNLG